MLARRDLLRAYLRDDGDIRDDVRRVFRDELSVDPDLVVVSVLDGRRPVRSPGRRDPAAPIDSPRSGPKTL